MMHATALLDLVQDPNTHCDLVAVSMLALASAHPSEADLVRLVAELVSDISDHLKVTVDRALVEFFLRLPFPFFAVSQGIAVATRPSFRRVFLSTD